MDDKRRNPLLIIIIVLVILLAIAIGIYLNLPSRKYTKNMEQGETFLKAKEYEKAIPYYEKAAKINITPNEATSKITEIYKAWGTELVDKEDREEAASVWVDGFNATKNEEIGILAGEEYLEINKNEEAASVFENVLEVNDKNTDAYVGIVEAMIRQNDFDKAEEFATTGFDKTQSEVLKEKIAEIEDGNIEDSRGLIRKRTTYYKGDKVYWDEIDYDNFNQASKITFYKGDGELIGEYSIENYPSGEEKTGYTLSVRRDANDNIIEYSVHREEYIYEDGLCTRIDTYDEASGKHLYFNLYLYDEDGLLIKDELYFVEPERLDSYFLYYYDEEGKNVRTENYSPDGVLLGYTEYIYDGDTLVEHKTYFEFLEEEGETYHTTYE